jgi:16S rRNA (cytosine967-C5)-methyltransferase
MAPPQEGKAVSTAPAPSPERPPYRPAQPGGRPEFRSNKPGGRLPYRSSRPDGRSAGGPDRPAAPRPEAIFISPSRLEAAKALYSLEKGAKVADVLTNPKGLKPEDEALLRELVYGCTRQKRLLDYHLNSLCQSPFEKLPIEVKIALRLGLYQLIFLDRVPAHAAVHESVNIAKKGGQEALSGFVNAVLRNAETKKATFEIKGDSDIDALSIRYSHPTWLVKKWAKFLSPEQLEEVLKADNKPHPVYLHVKPGTVEKVEEDLGKQNVRVAKVDWPSRTLSLKSHEGGLFSGESFQQGDWIVQDWVPQVMLEMLPLSEGQRAWDMCAAPGGKTIALAWKLGEKGQVMATDSSSERRKRLAENLKRTGLKQVMVYDGELKKMPPSQKFDLVWVDAPCSGTGVLSRRADLRWKIEPRNVLEHVQPQKDLMDEAQGHLYPTGHLVYSTCSLEKEENQEVIENFLKDHPEWKVVIPEMPGSYPEIIKDEKGLIFLPTPEHDGGFFAVLTRG